jgi:hypothetical protein
LKEKFVVSNDMPTVAQVRGWNLDLNAACYATRELAANELAEHLAAVGKKLAVKEWTWQFIFPLSKPFLIHVAD